MAAVGGGVDPPRQGNHSLACVALPQIEPDTGRYLSEDYVFLKRWRDIGEGQSAERAGLRRSAMDGWR